ncbi:MAG: creatininase family protein [Bacteroidota bacterium]|nr:creatininase family protein [Bacteroidota bacterium]
MTEKNKNFPAPEFQLWRLQTLTQKILRKHQYTVALLPIGSTEAHGMHVPYGSDAFHAAAIADRVCAEAWDKGARPLLLPAIQYGVQGNTMGFPMNLNVRQSTLDEMVMDIIRALEFHGIFKLIIVNGHGGNDFKPLLRDIYPKTKVFACLVDWWKAGNDRIKEIFENPGEHADELETSVDMALFGELVHLADAGDGSTHPSRFEAINRGWVSVARPWHLVTKDSTHGDPRKASVKKGEEYLGIVVERVAKFVVELAKEKMDKRFPY